MTRFTLRDVFWLTLVVAMGLGWWATYARLTFGSPVRVVLWRHFPQWVTKLNGRETALGEQGTAKAAAMA
jgi:hypothetical protein